MAATTTQRPAALPTPAPQKMPVPQGATKMSRIWLDDKGVPQKSATPVPVDENERRTPHVLHQCPHVSPVNGGGKQRCPSREWLLPDGRKPFCRDHGKELEPDRGGPSRLELVVRDTVALHGRSALPLLIPAAAAVADLAVTNPLLAAASAPVLAAGAYVTTKRTLTARAVKRGRLERGERAGRRYQAVVRQSRKAALLGAEAGGWVTALTAVDFTPGGTWRNALAVAVAGLGMVRWAIASQTWWMTADQRRRRGTTKVDVPATQAEAGPVQAPDPVRLRAVTTWAALIGCAGGPLAGTELVEFKRLPACEVKAESRTMLPNWSAKVVAKVEGSINMREQRPTLLGRIAAAYRCTYADVSFTADESDLSVGWLRVQPDNPLAETRMWVGEQASDWKAGRSVIGRFDDGQEIAYQWWTKTGAAHDLISGCTGSGKSELVAQLLLTSLHSNGLVLDWVGDPQGGQSYGVLKDYVDWFARDKSEIKLMLLAAVKEMHRRNDELSRHNIKTWFATAAMPLLVITLDEVQAYIDDPDILALVEMLVGQARKCGIKMRLITQIPAAYNLGGSTYIKEQLKAGQTLIFRAMTDVAGRSATDGDIPVDPTMLPTAWGANTCAAGETTAGLMFAQGLNGRDVYGRADYTGEKMEPWLVSPAGDPTVNPGVFGPEAQQESGVLWGDRKERARRLIEGGRRDEDILPGGKALELIEQASVSAAPADPARSTPGGQVPLADRARDKVLAKAVEVADAAGVAKRADILAAVKGEVAEGTAANAITALLEAGDLRRIKNGVFQVVGAPRSQVQLELGAAR